MARRWRGTGQGRQLRKSYLNAGKPRTARDFSNSPQCPPSWQASSNFTAEIRADFLFFLQVVPIFSSDATIIWQVTGKPRRHQGLPAGRTRIDQEPIPRCFRRLLGLFGVRSRLSAHDRHFERLPQYVVVRNRFFPDQNQNFASGSIVYGVHAERWRV